MNNLQFTTYNKQKGFTLFISMVVTGTLLIVASGIINLAVKQAFISSSARESQHAFYAADSGMECAIYWDVKNASGYSAFSTSTSSQINCNNQVMTVGGVVSSSFSFNFDPDPYCTIVTVTKNANGSTLIESKGYNTCSGSTSRRVERAVRVTY